MLLVLLVPLCLALIYSEIIWSISLNYEEIIRSPWFMAVLGLGFSYFYSFLWLFVEAVGFLDGQKIQPKKQYTLRDVYQTIWLQIKVHCYTVIFPLMIGTVANLIPEQGPMTRNPPPPVYVAVGQLVFCLFYFDFGFYFMHRALHMPFLFKHIHSVHHEYTAPFSFVTNYAHPLEIICVSVISVSAAKVIQLHPYLEILWTIVAVAVSTDAHSGYDVPTTLDKIPIVGKCFGGSLHHDLHHKYYTKNYSPFLTVLDEYMGTYIGKDDLVKKI